MQRSKIQHNQLIFSVSILLLGLVWIWITAEFFSIPTDGQIPTPKEGFLAPNINLQGIDGAIYQLSDMRGQAVLVNIWTSWCPPCKAEMPAMQKVYDTYKDQGFVILAVNATHQDSAAKAIKFVDDYGLSFPILLDENGRVTAAYQIHSFPTSFFINAEGLIKDVVIGGPMAEALLQTRVKDLLAGEQ